MARTTMERGLAGAPGASSWSNILKQLVGAAGQALPLYQQQQLYKMQLERAARGLPPLPASEVTPAGIPIHVQLDKRLLWIIGGSLAAGGLLLYFATRARRRS